jgi:hypothetical protein
MTKQVEDYYSSWIRRHLKEEHNIEVELND